MKRTAAEILREYGPFPGVERVNGVTYRRPARLVRRRRQAERLRSGERERGALDRRRRACRHGLRRPASVSARRRPHPEDRPADRARCSPRSPRPAAAAIGAGLGRRDALGRAVPRPQDPSGRSRRPGRSCARIESNRFVTGVTWVDGELWHATWEGEESELRRIDPRNGRGSGEPRDAARRGRVGAGVRWRRPVLLRRRQAAGRCAPSDGRGAAPRAAAVRGRALVIPSPDDRNSFTPSLRTKRSNPGRHVRRWPRGPGLLRRCAPRNDRISRCVRNLILGRFRPVRIALTLHYVMAGLVPAITDFAVVAEERKLWMTSTRHVLGQPGGLARGPVMTGEIRSAHPTGNQVQVPFFTRTVSTRHGPRRRTIHAFLSRGRRRRGWSACADHDETWQAMTKLR